MDARNPFGQYARVNFCINLIFPFSFLSLLLSLSTCLSHSISLNIDININHWRDDATFFFHCLVMVIFVFFVSSVSGVTRNAGDSIIEWQVANAERCQRCFQLIYTLRVIVKLLIYSTIWCWSDAVHTISNRTSECLSGQIRQSQPIPCDRRVDRSWRKTEHWKSNEEKNNILSGT